MSHVLHPDRIACVLASTSGSRAAGAINVPRQTNPQHHIDATAGCSSRKLQAKQAVSYAMAQPRLFRLPIIRSMLPPGTNDPRCTLSAPAETEQPKLQAANQLLQTFANAEASVAAAAQPAPDSIATLTQCVAVLTKALVTSERKAGAASSRRIGSGEGEGRQGATQKAARSETWPDSGEASVQRNSAAERDRQAAHPALSEAMLARLRDLSPDAAERLLSHTRVRPEAASTLVVQQPANADSILVRC